MTGHDLICHRSPPGETVKQSLRYKRVQHQIPGLIASSWSLWWGKPQALLPRATHDVGANNCCGHAGALTAHVRFHAAVGSTAPPPSVLPTVTPSYVHLNRVRKNNGFRQTEKGTRAIQRSASHGTARTTLTYSKKLATTSCAVYTQTSHGARNMTRQSKPRREIE